MSDTVFYLGGIALVGAWFHGRGSTWVDPETGYRSTSSVSCTTYDTDALRAIREHLCDGGVFVDKRRIPDDVLHEWVFRCPIEREDLPDGHVQGWFDPREGVPARMAEGGILDLARRVGSMGYIATDLYVALWSHLGARIGVRKGATIEWDDGSVEVLG